VRFTSDARRKRRSILGFDMTPMIDVVFQLIIFFLYTAQFTQLVRMPVNLPEERGDEGSGAMAAEVTIDIIETGEYVVDGEAMSLDRLGDLLQKEIERAGGDAGAIRVLIRPDRNLEASYVNAAVTRMSSLGIRAWRLGSIAPRGGG